MRPPRSGQTRGSAPTNASYHLERNFVSDEPIEVDNDTGKLTPEQVDASMDEMLKYETSPTGIILLKEAKFWFGTEFAYKSPEEKAALLNSDEPRYNNEEFGDQAGNDWWSAQPTDHLAADRGSYRYDDLWKQAAAYHHKFDEQWLITELKGIEAGPHTALDLFGLGRFITSPIKAFASLIRGMGRNAILNAVQRRPEPRLPPKGTPERRQIETARNRGVKAKKIVWRLSNR